MSKRADKRHLFSDWRDFGREYAIIVLGVLTALLAQQAAQAIDWHEKVEAALTDMDNELGSGNGPQAYQRLAIHDCVASQLDRIETAVNQGDRGASRAAIARFWVPNRTWDSLARDAATASDVSPHMPHGRMLQYRIAYEMTPAMQRLAEKELGDLGHLRALPTGGGPLDSSEKLAVLDAIEALRIDNETFARESRFLLLRMRMMQLRLDRSFVEHDMREAGAHYSGCIATPRLPRTAPGQTLGSVNFG